MKFIKCHFPCVSRESRWCSLIAHGRKIRLSIPCNVSRVRTPAMGIFFDIFFLQNQKGRIYTLRGFAIFTMFLYNRRSIALCTLISPKQLTLSSLDKSFCHDHNSIPKTPHLKSAMLTSEP
uniref:Uncharacterized protein n=1 Tax=Cacopsylla melanoneura TaxID=428564 RepID=A0A8D8X1I0_9HEMI